MTTSVEPVQQSSSALQFRGAKKAAREFYNKRAGEGLADCGDAASYKRWLSDAEANSRNLFMANRNPAWDNVIRSFDFETGDQILEDDDAALLVRKREYDAQLGHLNGWFPQREQYWLERYALESGLPPSTASAPQNYAGLPAAPAAATTMPLRSELPSEDAQPSPSSTGKEAGHAPDVPPVGPDLEERKRVFAAYKDECKAAGVNLTEGVLAKAAQNSWNTRDPVSKWKQGKDRPGDDDKIRRVLREKPHLNTAKPSR
jgi:hypothetical protein